MIKMSNQLSIKSMLGVTLIATALGLSACSKPDPDIKARQDIMKNYGDAMKSVGDMVKAPDTFDIAVVKEQAAFLAAESASPWQHFGNKESLGESTEAVWSNPDEFLAESENFQKVTAEFNVAAQAATSAEDIKPTFGEVGASCKSCHTDFKMKDEK